MNHEKLMDAKALSSYLNLPLSSIYDLSHRGAIPVIKIGQRLRFSPSSIKNWLRQNSQGGGRHE